MDYKKKILIIDTIIILCVAAVGGVDPTPMLVDLILNCNFFRDLQSLENSLKRLHLKIGTLKRLVAELSISIV